jgi:hypothetical protein
MERRKKLRDKIDIDLQKTYTKFLGDKERFVNLFSKNNYAILN